MTYTKNSKFRTILAKNLVKELIILRMNLLIFILKNVIVSTKALDIPFYIHGKPFLVNCCQLKSLDHFVWRKDLTWL